MPAARAAASLGELVQRTGLIDAAQLERLRVELRDRVRAGRPTSLARLLVEKGFEGARVRAAAATGAGLGAVRCDACGAAHEVVAALSGREFACPRCSSLVVGLGELGSSGERAAPRAPEALGAPVPVPGVPGMALRFPTTPPVPGFPTGETTRGYLEVLPIPGATPVPRTPAAVEDAPTDGKETVMFGRVLPLPGGPAAAAVPMVPAALEGIRAGGHTLAYANVLPLPGAAAVPHAPAAPAVASTPLTPPHAPVASPAGAVPLTPGAALGDGFYDSNAVTRSDPDRQDLEAARLVPPTADAQASGKVRSVPETKDAPVPGKARSGPATADAPAPRTRKTTVTRRRAAAAPGGKLSPAVILVGGVVALGFAALFVLWLLGVFTPARTKPGTGAASGDAKGSGK